MSNKEEQLYDLLVKKAIYGLDESEETQLAQLDDGKVENEFRTLEMAAAAIGLADLEIEEMPAHLRSAIAASAADHFSSVKTVVDEAETRPVYRAVREESSSGSSWFGWLGWAAAAAACIALALNIWLPRTQQPEIAKVNPPAATPTPKAMAPAEARDTLASTAKDLIKATWTAGNVKGISDIVGDIVWSDEKQAGYMTFKGLPANDPSKETYQLWIMDENQGDKEPIDGGTFDVNANGEVVIPIDAKLKARSPHLFAVTIEKPGGVVVSKRERIAALAKVETPERRSS